jgi:hypothetical protein
MLVHPDLDGRVSFDRTGESEKLTHQWILSSDTIGTSSSVQGLPQNSITFDSFADFSHKEAQKAPKSAETFLSFLCFFVAIKSLLP